MGSSDALCSREFADRAFEMSTVDLRHAVTERLCLQGTHALLVQVGSLACRTGQLWAINLVMEVSFPGNPHYDPVIGGFDGCDVRIVQPKFDDSSFDGFLTLSTDCLAPLLPLFEGKGKSYLIITVGGIGRHRHLVFLAHAIAKWLMERGLPVTVNL